MPKKGQLEVAPVAAYFSSHVAQDDFVIHTTDPTQQLVIATNSNLGLTMLGSNVALNKAITNAAYALDVGGTINATSVLANGSVVSTSSWSNYSTGPIVTYCNVSIGTSNSPYGLSVVGTAGCTGLAIERSTGALGATVTTSSGIYQDASSNLIAYPGSNAPTSSVKIMGNNLSTQIAKFETSGMTTLSNLTLTGEGTGVASTASGSWTPTIYGGTTAGTVTYNNQSGTYFRAGKIVIAQCEVSWSTLTGTGDLRIGGLPLPIASSAGGNTPVTSVMTQNMPWPTGTNTLHVVGGGTGTTFLTMVGARAGTFYQVVQCSNAGAYYAYFTLMYTTS